jgi:replication-associated recombination protein RarA
MTELFRAPLTEQYRPKDWSDVVGQDKVVNRLLALRRRGLSGCAYWLSGQSGTGKTTIARLIAAEVAEAFCVQEVDAAGLTVAALRELADIREGRALPRPKEAFTFVGTWIK